MSSNNKPQHNNNATTAGNKQCCPIEILSSPDDDLLNQLVNVIQEQDKKAKQLSSNNASIIIDVDSGDNNVNKQQQQDNVNKQSEQQNIVDNKNKTITNKVLAQTDDNTIATSNSDNKQKVRQCGHNGGKSSTRTEEKSQDNNTTTAIEHLEHDLNIIDNICEFEFKQADNNSRVTIEQKPLTDHSTIQVKRAAVLLLFAACIAHSREYKWDTALTLGQQVCVFNNAVYISIYI